MALTPKQKKFVEAYLGAANNNATQSARLAGYKGNNGTLGAVGAENLKKPQIAKAIAEGTEKVLKSLGFGKEECLAEMVAIARMQPDPSQFKFEHKIAALDKLFKHKGMYQAAAPNEETLRHVAAMAQSAAQQFGTSPDAELQYLREHFGSVLPLEIAEQLESDLEM